MFKVVPGKERATLDEKIADSIAAYAALLKSKDENNYDDKYEQCCLTADQKLLDVLHGMDSSALCLSGGGIRSASYCLGILQGLARFGFSSGNNDRQKNPHVLLELDYLSTVSGGGYIGSWLMAWTKRLATPTQGTPIVAEGTNPSASAFLDVVTALAGKNPHTSGDPAPRAVRHLRDYTSFLAPKFGLTLDTWTLAAIVLRNLLVNWIMILPIFLWLFATVQVVHHGLFRLAALWVQLAGFYIPFGCATIFFMFAGLIAGIRMPSRQAEKLFGAKLEPHTVLVFFILPLALSSVLLLAIWLEMRDLWNRDPGTLIFWFSVTASVSFAIVPIVRTAFTNKNAAAYSDHSPWTRYVTGVIASIAAGALLSVSLYGVGSHAYGWLGKMPVKAEAKVSSTTILKTSDDTVVDLRVSTPTESAAKQQPLEQTARPEVNLRLNGQAADRFILFGFPVVWILVILASSLFSSLIGEYEADIDREWWARSGGIMMCVLIGWTFAQAIVIYTPQIFSQSLTFGRLSSAGLLTGLLGALGGFGTSGIGAGNNPKKANTSWLGGFLNRFGLIVPGLCFIALLVIVLLVTDFEITLAHKLGGTHDVRGHVWIWCGSLVLGLLLNWAININIFSLHGMYRMRLMRAFLGSSNPRRRPDVFTGFDERDLIWETDVPCGREVPLHIINAAVNLVGTDDTAWTQRKAEGFTFSPLFCGGWRLGYVPTACYGGNRGVSLATAMAISGAAFNPNMGYHSSPLVTLIMTLFNVRLGWWLPNPKYRPRGLRRQIAKLMHVSMQDLMSKKSPRLALGPLINEMLGGTNDTTPYIELTDGGHFENLGLYEMVLRRCKRIIVVDAGADPKCEFEDLGNALRKIEIDLGIPIEFRDHKIHMQEGTVETNLRCAIADIRYECVDGTSACSNGTLIYIKAGLNGQEPADVLQYAKIHPTFPHEATTNQFFTESQFESYRHLGSFSVDQIVSKPDPESTTPAGCLGNFFNRAEAYVKSANNKADAEESHSKLASSVIEEALKKVEVARFTPDVPAKPVV